MDLTELYKAYSNKGRNPATEPKNQFKIMAYAYMEGIYSTRKIESASGRDINFMWLLGGAPAPDHKTINRFRKERLGKIIECLFYQLVKILCELGEVKYENVFDYGTKIEANANRYTFVWKKSVDKNEIKMHERANLAEEEINKLYFTDFRVKAKRADADMHKMIAFLETKMVEQRIEMVKGNGKRKSKEQKLLESLCDYRERQLKYEANKEIFEGRNSYSKTDNDATFMRMKDDHMQNGQLKPGYNVQLAVENEYVIGSGVFPNCTDVCTLKPLLERMYLHNPEMRILRLIADSGYESKENYLYLEKKGILITSSRRIMSSKRNAL